jgi:peroxiredoxin
MVTRALEAAEGGDLRLDQGRADVVVLAFFARWCRTSRQALLTMEALRASHGPERLTVVAVGEGESAAQVMEFARRHGVTVPVAFDRGAVVAGELGLPTLPAFVVLDRAGTVRHVHAGYHGEDDRAELVREVTTLLVEEARRREVPGAEGPRTAAESSDGDGRSVAWATDATRFRATSAVAPETYTAPARGSGALAIARARSRRRTTGR